MSVFTRSTRLHWLRPVRLLAVLSLLLLTVAVANAQDTTKPKQDSIPVRTDTLPKKDSLPQTDSLPAPKADTVPQQRRDTIPAASLDSAEALTDTLPRPGADTLSRNADTTLVIGTVLLPAETGDLSGTSVQVKGQPAVIITDSTGKFAISARPGQTLVFSRVGFRNREVRLTGQKMVNVNMQTAASDELDQVVVVSYGKQRQRNITGSIAVVESTDIKDIPAAEFGQKLNGKVPGLQINQVTGRPGQAMTFRLRGASSLNSGNQPLFVVDGQPVLDINQLNPDDIESFSILKDASSTALYGSRAANGVVMITTRTAKPNKTSINLNSYVGWQSVGERGRPDMMNAQEFAGFMKGYYEDKRRYEGTAGDPPREPTLEDVPEEYRNPAQYGAGTDWYDLMLRTAMIQNHTIQISTGTDKLLSAITASYFNQEGVMLNTGMERFSFRANNEFRPHKRVKLGFNFAPSFQNDKNTRAPLDGNRQILVLGMIASPLVPHINADGSYPLRGSSTGMYAMPNPYQQLLNANVNQKTFRGLGNAYADLEILKNLNFRSSINVDLGYIDYNAFYNGNYGTFGTPPPNTNINAVHSSYNYTSWLAENTLAYKFDIGASHNFDLLAGYAAQKYSRNFRGINGTNFPNDLIPWIIQGSGVNSGTTNNTAWDMVSWFGRLNYDFQNKYFLTANIRRDASSRFGTEERWGYFPSVSAGWVISDEHFFPKINALSFLKFRGSYGLTGNNNIGDYTQVSLMSPTPYTFEGATTSPGYAITSLGNPRLSWETSKQLDLGLEASLFGDRIQLTYDYYKKETEDLLYRIDLPSSSGYTQVTSNVGSFRMWGHEIAVSSRNLTGTLKWNTSFNVAFNDNRVLSLQNGNPIGGVNTYNDYNRTAVGRRIGEFWGYVFDGVYMNQAEFNSQAKHNTSVVGSTRMKDINGDGVINQSDKDYIGNPNPRYLYGMTNDLSYKNFDLSVVVSGAAGYDVLYTNYQNLLNIDGIFNVTKDMANRWRSEANPGNGQVPRTMTGTTELYRLASSNWVSPGDYITVRNITLGYTFQKEQLKWVKSARLYISGNQLWVFTKYKHQNPEANDSRDQATTAGQDNGSFPVPRTFLIGANFSF
ncbi:MAG: TonB-dependent receptor [Candidatus Pseudobacter hemicellulosilyticus]|uniref:TonB-dependent receptor n=1 Tax=Candidatus Pseudobacter hemicellulosilyticus TaxID=3121375 RepID=A0AAJ5WQH7_9BACT|nr:MAG: TonB-dependent receptor [Pseudobacter sp.]